MTFDPILAGAKAREIRALRKAKNYTKRASKLDPYRFEICELYRSNHSLELIQTHLDSTHKCKAHRSTILRYIQSIGVVRNG